jgi:hypothetical protein
MPKASCVVYVLGSAVVSLAMSVSARAAEEFPYTAYVAVESAEVVSGPGHRYYATQHVPYATPVEVYREEPSGWLAIRPPEGAFSWVPAEAIERTGERGVGRVVEPAGAWIGTTAERVGEHRQQVTLKEGELVEILGEKTVASGEEEQVWLKIAPPAGEFRWIHLRDVSRLMPEPRSPHGADAEPSDHNEGEPEVADRIQRLAEELRQMRDAALPSQVRPGKHDRPETDAAEPRRFQSGAGAIALRDLEPAGSSRIDRQLRTDRLYRSDVEQVQYRSSGSATRPSLSPDGFVPRKRKTGSEPLEAVPVPSGHVTSSSSSVARGPIGVASVPSQMSRMEVPDYAGSGPAPGDTSRQEMGRQLDQIEVELSLMLAQDKSLWDLTAVKDRVNQLVERGPDPATRGRARLLLDKVEQFATAFEVDQHRRLSPIAAQAAASASDTAANSSSLADPRYDGQGWLKPVISRRGDQPPAPFALVDGEGKPLCFVTPSPGLNLNRYLNKQVGVYGRRGYVESLKTPHVTAERAIDLERQWR